MDGVPFYPEADNRNKIFCISNSHYQRENGLTYKYR